MNCEDARLFLSALLDEALESGEADALRSHLETCAPCRDEAAQAFRQDRALAEFGADAGALRAKVREALAGEGHRGARRRLWLRRPGQPSFSGPVAAAAALMLIAALVTFLASRPTPVPPEAVTPKEARPVAVEERLSPTVDKPGPISRPPSAPVPPTPQPRPEPPLVAEVPRRDPSPQLAPGAVEGPAPRPPTETVIAAATVERVEGEVFLMDDGRRLRARPGQPVLAGNGIETGRRSGATLAYLDGTRLDLGGETSLAEVREKRVNLRVGTLSADVKKQPAGQTLVFGTPQGEARVLGTSLRLTVDPGATQLDVKEGKVRLIRSDGKAVDVGTGFTAIAAVGVELTPRPTPGPGGAVWSFTLVNADTDQPVAGYDPLPDGAALQLSSLPTRNLNVRANTVPRKVGSVRFGLDRNPSFRVENGLSGTLYSLAGDMNGNYNAWLPAPGTHTVTATPYGAADGQGAAGTPLSITLHVK